MAGLMLTLFHACVVESEDPGPLQEGSEEYYLSGFSSVKVGWAIVLHISYGEEFYVSARGDRRNLDDLRIQRHGDELHIGFRSGRNRKHTTYVDVTMPSLNHVDISGASVAAISGFSNMGTLVLNVSGASLCDISADADAVRAVVSGASTLRARGTSTTLDVTLSGSSLLKAFPLNTLEADVTASGASHAEVSVEQFLYAAASGTSQIIYRGDPDTDISMSGASSVTHQP